MTDLCFTCSWNRLYTFFLESNIETNEEQHPDEQEESKEKETSAGGHDNKEDADNDDTSLVRFEFLLFILYCAHARYYTQSSQDLISAVDKCKSMVFWVEKSMALLTLCLVYLLMHNDPSTIRFSPPRVQIKTKPPQIPTFATNGRGRKTSLRASAKQFSACLFVQSFGRIGVQQIQQIFNGHVCVLLRRQGA